MKMSIHRAFLVRRLAVIIVVAMIIFSACVIEPSEQNTESATEHKETTTVEEPPITEESDFHSDAIIHEDVPLVPTKTDVLELRALVLEGMSEDEIFRLTDFIKAANLRLESAWFYKNIFDELSDPDSFYWTYFDRTGEIQIGWAEWDGQTSAVLDYNQYDAAFYITVFSELKESVVSGMLDDDLDKLIELCSKAKETHDVEYTIELYHMLHDMDYFLLRYGPSDVGMYVSDTSTISKYYGSLSIWESYENRP